MIEIHDMMANVIEGNAAVRDCRGDNVEISLAANRLARGGEIAVFSDSLPEGRAFPSTFGGLRDALDFAESLAATAEEEG